MKNFVLVIFRLTLMLTSFSLPIIFTEGTYENMIFKGHYFWFAYFILLFLSTIYFLIIKNYFELINAKIQNEKLIYKYCKTTTSSIEVYQESPIYLDNLDDLKYIKVEIGEKAYVKDGISWYEYYYEGNGFWIPSGTGRTTGQINDNISIEDRILSYIPDSKDLVLRRDGGCMLANGDIFCWGNNKYKKAGIENYGQIDTTLKADYVNTPVMLKVQIENSIQNSKKWYNNPYRVNLKECQ